MKKNLRVIGILLAGILLTCYGCVNSPDVSAEPTKLSVWIAYWDIEGGIKDLGKIDRKIEKLSWFAAYFDENGKLFVPKEINVKRLEISDKKPRYESYLTFVNDRKLHSGAVVPKDIDILREKFADDDSVDSHIKEIVDIAKEGKYDGIEIDYERIWIDEEIGAKFSLFVNRLALQAIKNKLKLRIVLEPGIPFHYTNFARGPEYVVMMYNLFGTHSGPGPKADDSFIQNTLSRMEALPPERAAALSTGGCLWSGAGEKRFLTEQEAQSLLSKHAAKRWKRDKNSNCVYFDYRVDGTNYTVWYADVQALNFWINAAKKAGERNISLWRLGGNADINKVK